MGMSAAVDSDREVETEAEDRVGDADELDTTIRKLSTMRDGLRHAAACRAPSHMECPTFRRIMRAVASAAIQPSKRRTSASARARFTAK